MVFSLQWNYLILPAVVILHLVASPYTKVEESFNIQAIHDILKHGIPTRNAYYTFKGHFDHIEFPGSVPRTFIGSLVVAFCTGPITWLGRFEGLGQQSIARGALGLLNAAAFLIYTRAIKKAYGGHTATWYTVLQGCQFHVIYYSSRTLPNTFAFCLSTLAHAALLPDPQFPLGTLKRARLALYILTLTTIIFRAELALLLGSQALCLLLKTSGFSNQISVLRHTILPAVPAGAIAGLILTVSIDTYFWQSSSFLWPEGAAFLFNVLPSEEHQGASAWGTSPWYWYFASAIPRLLLNPSLLLLPWAILYTPQRLAILENIAPAVIYTTLYSFLPHKETRFLFPIVPPLTLGIALALSYLSNRRQKTAKIVMGFLLTSTLVTAFISHAIILPLSAQTYPGGHALQMLHAYHDTIPQNTTEYPHFFKPQIRVHLTNLALQTGVTRFLQRDQLYTASSTTPQPQWIYDKTSLASDFLDPTFWNQFDYVVVEDPAHVIGDGTWRIVGESKSLSQQRPRLLRPHEKRATIVLKDKEEEEEARKEKDGLYELFKAMYGTRIAWIYGLVHDVFREGCLVGGTSLTGGYWVEWGLQTRLYILESSQSETEP